MGTHIMQSMMVAMAHTNQPVVHLQPTTTPNLLSKARATKQTAKGSRKIDNNKLALQTNVDIFEESQIAERGAIHKLLDVYCTVINPTGISHNVTFTPHISLDTNSNQLQYYVALCSAARALEQPHEEYELKARALAKQVWDEISFESAQGFLFMALYYSYEDLNLSEHYREISMSIIRRLGRVRGNSSPKAEELLLRCEIGAVFSVNSIDYSWEEMERKMNSLEIRMRAFLQKHNPPKNPNRASIQELFTLCQFVFDFYKSFLSHKKSSPSQARISEQELLRVNSSINQAKTQLSVMMQNLPIFPLFFASIRGDSILAQYYLFGDYFSAVTQLEDLLHYWESNAHLVRFGMPFMVQILKNIVLLTMNENQFGLSEAFLSVIKKFGPTMKEARKTTAQLQKQLANATNNAKLRRDEKKSCDYFSSTPVALPPLPS